MKIFLFFIKTVTMYISFYYYFCKLPYFKYFMTFQLFLLSVIINLCFSDKGRKICGHIHSTVTSYPTSEEICQVIGPVQVAVLANGPSLKDNPSRRLRMANSFTNMNITNSIKVLVSKRRNRYKQDGFNLDLTCILFIFS